MGWKVYSLVAIVSGAAAYLAEFPGVAVIGATVASILIAFLVRGAIETGKSIRNYIRVLRLPYSAEASREIKTDKPIFGDGLWPVVAYFAAFFASTWLMRQFF